MTNIYDDFQEIALDTLIVPASDVYSYSLLGISGEAGEVAELIWNMNVIKDKAELINEIGDVFWYCAVAAKVIMPETKFSDIVRLVDKQHLRVFSTQDICVQLLITASKIAELVKKYIRQGLTEEQKEDIIGYISDITSDLDFIRQKYWLGSMKQILLFNNSKLAQRKRDNTLKGVR